MEIKTRFGNLSIWRRGRQGALSLFLSRSLHLSEKHAQKPTGTPHGGGSSKNLVRHGPRAPQAPTGGGHGIQHHRCCPARRKLHTLTPLHTLAAQAEGQVDVLWLDRHAAAVDARAVGVGKQRHDVRLCGLLRREDRAALEAQTLLLCTRHLTHQTLERRLLQQQVSGALELADLTQRHGPRTPAALRVLHTRCRVDSLGCLLALLGRDRFLRPCRLLRMCHRGGHGIQHHRCCPARRKLHTLTPLHTLAAQAEGQVDVLWLDRHAAAVDARAVGVGKQRHDVRLCGLLRREDRAALEAQTLLLCTRHLTHQTLERRLLQQQVSGALELADLTQRHGPRTPAALRVLHTRCRVDSLGCLLALLGRNRFLRPCRLLRMCHSYLLFVVFAVI
ncbi:hypothetical protein LSM04_000491 [Trypanosoma melophagium]|uniref:uncharacterized protein n=1 Tax=Trypanosoma melophagium TaxID=715481 RepID=UPI00351A4E6A|nr:hypothetical protein LSM04_000491 [Trypanosoma melophagium]